MSHPAPTPARPPAPGKASGRQLKQALAEARAATHLLALALEEASEGILLIGPTS